MGGEPIPLTDSEIRLFYLVFQGLRSSEIAGELGLARQTVDNAIFEARQKLGGLTRKQVANKLAQSRGWVRDIKHTPAENTLRSVAAAGHPLADSNHGELRIDRSSDALQAEDRAFDTSILDRFPFSPEPGKRNRADALQRIAMIMTRTALLLAFTAALLWVYGRA